MENSRVVYSSTAIVHTGNHAQGVHHLLIIIITSRSGLLSFPCCTQFVDIFHHVDLATYLHGFVKRAVKARTELAAMKRSWEDKGERVEHSLIM